MNPEFLPMAFLRVPYCNYAVIHPKTLLLNGTLISRIMQGLVQIIAAVASKTPKIPKYSE